MKDDVFFMEQAYQQAQKAYRMQEVPIGAILVDQDGRVIARGYNQSEKKQSQLMHAEMLVIARATKKMNSWRLSGMTLYVTVQPCMMCLGAIYLSRVSRVVYGVESPKYGATLEQIVSSCESKDKIYQNLHTTMQSINYEPAKLLLQLFFQKKRSEQDGQQNGFSKNQTRVVK